jgi:hypothetical protein
MGKDTLLFIGLDTHKEFTEVAYSEDLKVTEGIENNPSATFLLRKGARHYQTDR